MKLCLGQYLCRRLELQTEQKKSESAESRSNTWLVLVFFSVGSEFKKRKSLKTPDLSFKVYRKNPSKKEIFAVSSFTPAFTHTQSHKPWAPGVSVCVHNCVCVCAKCRAASILRLSHREANLHIQLFASQRQTDGERGEKTESEVERGRVGERERERGSLRVCIGGN